MNWQQEAINKTKPENTNAPHFLYVQRLLDTEYAELVKKQDPKSYTLIGTCAGSERGVLTEYFVGFNK